MLKKWARNNVGYWVAVALGLYSGISCADMVMVPIQSCSGVQFYDWGYSQYTAYNGACSAITSCPSGYVITGNTVNSTLVCGSGSVSQNTTSLTGISHSSYDNITPPSCSGYGYIYCAKVCQ